MNSLLLLFFAKKFFCDQGKWGLLYRYYKFSVDIVFGRCSSELAELFLLPYLCGRSTRYSNRLILLSPFLDVLMMSLSAVSSLTQLDCGIFCLQNAFP